MLYKLNAATEEEYIIFMYELLQNYPNITYHNEYIDIPENLTLAQLDKYNLSKIGKERKLCYG